MIDDVLTFVRDNQTLIMWILGAILVPGIYVWWQTNQGKKIAVDGGVYRKPVMQINAMFKLVDRSGHLSAYIGVAFRKHDQFAVLHVPFFFNNIGTKSLEDVKVAFKFSPLSTLPIDREIKSDKPEMRSFHRESDSISIHYKFGTVHPQFGIPHFEILRLDSQRTPMPEKFTVLMSAKDQLPLVVHITLHIVNNTQIKEVWEYAIHNSATNTQLTFDYICAIPESKRMKTATGFYQDCIIKRSAIPIPGIPGKDFSFTPFDEDTESRDH